MNRLKAAIRKWLDVQNGFPGPPGPMGPVGPIGPFGYTGPRGQHATESDEDYAAYSRAYHAEIDAKTRRA